MRKQQERLQLEQQQPQQQQQQQRQLKQQAAVAQQRGLSARLKLEPVAVSAASRPQGSPAACLTLALPAPGWREQ
jgi:hypothetical protein